eukprot:m.224640 g.224640  ORF g.224640 m.224640 type:complete len:563 (-) comp17294_c0_seq1:3198-4886(-)
MAFRQDGSSAALPDMSVARSNPLSRENLFDRVNGSTHNQNAQYQMNARSAEMRATATLPSEHVDVLVIGAGISGLTAAAALRANGCSVAVLEANSRVGGRTVTSSMQTAVGDHYVDLGGQWISPQSQPHATELVMRLGLTLFPQFCEGRHLLQVGSPKVQSYSGTIPFCLGLLANLNLGSVLVWFESLVTRVNPSNPNELQGAKGLDQQSVEDSIRSRQWYGPILGLMESMLRCTMGADPHQLSTLFVLFYSRAAGTMNNLIETDGGGQECRVEGGTLQISEKLAASLPKDALHLNSPVLKIEKQHDGYHVVYGQGRLKTCRRVILALAPSQIGQIEFTPALPAWRQHAYNSLKMGHLIKVVISYKTAFWRERGMSGQLVSNQGPLCIVMDATNSSGSAPALVGFIGGDDAARWTTTGVQPRKQAVLEHLIATFGPEAGDIIEYVERDWKTEPYAGGCPVNLIGPGDMATMSFDRLRQPHEGIYFAGTEMATCWPGYINGAAQAGWNAARDVLAASGIEAKGIPNIDAVLQADTDPMLIVAGVGVAVVGLVAGFVAWKKLSK